MKKCATMFAFFVSSALTTPAFSQTLENENSDLSADVPEVATPTERTTRASNNDIIVTAQRREATIQDVPFSIAAVGGEQLQAQGLNDPESLKRVVPGLTLNAGDKSIAVVAIRGNTSTFRSATMESPVAFFVDDVYYPNSTDLNLNFYDVNRVEILRGPQGTLFGRNVVGGAIAVITNDPVYETEFMGQATIGNAGKIRTEGMFNTALSDNSAFRIAFSSDRTDGQIKTPNLDGNYGENDSISARAKLLFEPTERLRALLSVDYTRSDGNGAPFAFLPGGPQVVPAGFGNYSTDNWVNSSNVQAPNDQRLRGGLLRLDYELGGGELTSITAYRLNDTYSYLPQVDIDAPPPLDYNFEFSNRSFTQEIRYASAPGKLSYVVGLYYLHADTDDINTLAYRPLAGSLLAAFGVPPCPAAPAPCPGFSVRRDQKGITNSYAAFGELEFDVTDSLSLILGGRYTKDRKHLEYLATSHDGLAIPALSFSQLGVPGRVPFQSKAEDTVSWDAFTPKATVRFSPNRDMNFYLTYSEGFKSGGFVDNAYRNPAIPLDPERSTNIEAGAKLRLFDDMLNLNIAVFRQKTKDLQNFGSAGGQAITYNGTALTKGLELESSLFLPGDFNLSFNYNYYDAKYTDLLNPGTGVQNAGNPLKYTPEHAFSLNASKRFELPSGIAITPQADFAYNSKISTTDDDTLRLYPNLFDDTEGKTFNASLMIEDSSGNLSARLWGKNLFNNYQILYADDVTAFITGLPNTTHYWRVNTNTPRSYGITVTYRN